MISFKEKRKGQKTILANVSRKLTQFFYLPLSFCVDNIIQIGEAVSRREINKFGSYKKQSPIGSELHLSFSKFQRLLSKRERPEMVMGAINLV